MGKLYLLTANVELIFEGINFLLAAAQQNYLPAQQTLKDKADHIYKIAKGNPKEDRNKLIKLYTVVAKYGQGDIAKDARNRLSQLVGGSIARDSPIHHQPTTKPPEIKQKSDQSDQSDQTELVKDKNPILLSPLS